MPVLRRDAPREPQGERLRGVGAAAVGGAALPRLRRRDGRGLALLRELRPRDGLRVRRCRIAVIPGDGIGPEVIDAALGPIERAAAKHGVTLELERLPYGADHYLKTKQTLPDLAFDHLRDKANAIPAHKIWQETFKRVAAEFAGIDAEHRYVDALAMELVRDPERFQVIVTNNLYGDILSDLGAALVGGLGLAASANIHPGRGGAGLFEPVHGSAPPLAGKGIANPMAAVLAGGVVLEQPRRSPAARRPRAAGGAL